MIEPLYLWRHQHSHFFLLGIEIADPLPRDDYGSARIAAVVILVGLFVDSLLIAGIYNKVGPDDRYILTKESSCKVWFFQYKIKTDVFYPWFLFYSFLIVSLLVIAVFVGINAEENNRFAAFGPALAAVILSLVYSLVYRLFRIGLHPQKSKIMLELQRVTLEPLVQRVQSAAGRNDIE